MKSQWGLIAVAAVLSLCTASGSSKGQPLETESRIDGQALQATPIFIGKICADNIPITHFTHWIHGVGEDRDLWYGMSIFSTATFFTPWFSRCYMSDPNLEVSIWDRQPGPVDACNGDICMTRAVDYPVHAFCMDGYSMFYWTEDGLFSVLMTINGGPQPGCKTGTDYVLRIIPDGTMGGGIRRVEPRSGGEAP
jgi:hypothetical protein